MKKALFISAITLLASASALAHGPGNRGEGGRGKAGAGHHLFERADANGDGKLTKDEWTKRALERFDAIDTNRDGKVTRQESRTHCESMKADRFAAMDRDSDGKLSREEVSRMPRERFDALDTNRDGYLSQEELEHRRGGRDFCDDDRMFSHFDKNGDGVVTRDEVRKASEAKFAELDANGDGSITREEMRAKHREMRHGKGKRGGEGRGEPRAPRGEGNRR
jgi:Ca2+-binding EF-hand superfamily protein